MGFFRLPPFYPSPPPSTAPPVVTQKKQNFPGILARVTQRNLSKFTPPSPTHPIPPCDGFCLTGNPANMQNRDKSNSVDFHTQQHEVNHVPLHLISADASSWKPSAQRVQTTSRVYKTWCWYTKWDNARLLRAARHWLLHFTQWSDKVATKGRKKDSRPIILRILERTRNSHAIHLLPLVHKAERSLTCGRGRQRSATCSEPDRNEERRDWLPTPGAPAIIRANLWCSAQGARRHSRVCIYQINNVDIFQYFFAWNPQIFPLAATSARENYFRQAH